MELKNEFRVSVPVETAWATLTDVEYIAPCMPGAQLTEVDGEEFKGQVKVKVGLPILQICQLSILEILTRASTVFSWL